MQSPQSESPDLHLTQPTPEECNQIWSNTAAFWKDSLTKSVYLIESEYLTTVPLAKNKGMTTWVLVNKNLPPDQRQILCSCESFRKRSLTSDKNGNVKHCLVHGIASVFCPSEYRGRGYGSRHMKELAKMLRGWQSEYGESIGSVLYSDIGKEYYARLGWLPNATNWHFVFLAAKAEEPLMARLLTEPELGDLCLLDEALIGRAMAAPSSVHRRVVILPDMDHMLWHIRKEEFATHHIFGKIPDAKGAIAGSPGKRVWAIWVHRYYAHPDSTGNDGENVLYILRLVVEGDDTANKPNEDQASPSMAAFTEQATALKTVLQAAQAEAAQWRLNHVSLWEPSPLVRRLIGKNGLDAAWIEREEESISSSLWFAEGEGEGKSPVWLNNEHYAWC